jgi:hypothetical protein|tara:strand:- start:1112 stop:1222 length:111 start_codon:yes stop_codon:yes gene_type:complete
MVGVSASANLNTKVIAALFIGKAVHKKIKHLQEAGV